MVNIKDSQLDTLFQALSDSTRRAMLCRLATQEMSVAQLAEPFALSKAAITKHLKVLENAGLLKRTIDGRIHYCRIEAQPLAKANEWLQFYQSFWNTKLDALNDFLSDEQDLSS